MRCDVQLFQPPYLSSVVVNGQVLPGVRMAIDLLVDSGADLLRPEDALLPLLDLLHDLRVVRKLPASFPEHLGCAKTHAPSPVPRSSHQQQANESSRRHPRGVNGELSQHCLPARSNSRVLFPTRGYLDNTPRSISFVVVRPNALASSSQSQSLRRIYDPNGSNLPGMLIQSLKR